MSAFNGFGPQALAFLKALDFHQSREWFAENKALYVSELEKPRADLVEALTEAFAANGIALRGDRKKSVYRIYRDVRFSNDKRPFNRHVSALLTPSGEKREEEGSFFIKVGIEGCFMAAGFYLDGSDRLKEFRNRILADPEGFRRMLAALKKGGLEPGREGALKRLPRDFSDVAEPDLAEAMKLKHFYVQEDIAPETLTSPRLVDAAVAFVKKAMPLLEWGRAFR